MDTKEMLIAARKRVEHPDSWASSGAKDGRDGRCCTTTAIWEAAGREYHFAKPVLLHFMKANELKGSDLGGIWNWNDAPERTHAEILAAFDKAIEDTESSI